MANVGLFFGSDTGNTEAVAQKLQDALGEKNVQIHDIAESTPAQIAGFDLLLIGIPTWYYGESQCDWDDFVPELKGIDFSNKKVAIFGCGDQEDYAEYFCDAMGTIHEIICRKGAQLVGKWPIAGYAFEASKALIDDQHFVGLCIDEDRQHELTNERIELWAQQLIQEMSLDQA